MSRGYWDDVHCVDCGVKLDDRNGFRRLLNAADPAIGAPAAYEMVCETCLIGPKQTWSDSQ